MTRYSSTMTEALQEIREGFSSKQIKMAIGIASDKRYAGGNMTGAVNAIEKIKKGLSDHPQVAAVLKRQNEDIQEDGHTDVASAKNQVKVAMTALQKMEMELGKLNDEDSLPSWWTNKVAIAVDKIDGMADYLDTQVEEVELDEMKMDDPKLVKAFDKMKKGDIIKLKTSSTISKGKDFVEYIVKSKNVVNKGRVEKVTLVTKGNEGAVKKFLYKRDGKVTFAIGDMGASIDDIKEGTWALPDSPKAKAELKKLMSKPIKLGKEGDDAADKLYALIGDDELFDDLYVAGKKNPNGDARDVVKKHMKRLGIKEEVGLKEAALAIAEKLKVSDGVGAWIKDFQKSDAPQFQGKSEEDRKKMALAAFADAGGKLEETELDEGRMKELHGYIEKGMSAQEIAKKMKLDVKTIKSLMDETELGEQFEYVLVDKDNKVIGVFGTKQRAKDFEPKAKKQPALKNRLPLRIQPIKPKSKKVGDTVIGIGEEVELDEAPKMKYALVGTDMKIYSMGSDERDLKLDRRSLEQRFKDVAPLKMARLKTAQSIGDKVDKSQLKEEEGPDNRPDSAKEVEQGRDDKKKTRIAQLQLQIAKAQETINKLNAQEKPNG